MPTSGSRLKATAARLISRLALDKSVALSLIQSRSSDRVSGGGCSSTASRAASCAGRCAGFPEPDARADGGTARGWRIGARRRGMTACRAAERPSGTAGVGDGSAGSRSPSSASAAIAAAAAAFSTSAATATSLACGADDGGGGLADPASVIMGSQRLSGTCGAMNLPRVRAIRTSPSPRRVVRSGHHADLRQEAEHIFLRPLLYELAIGDAVDGDRGRLQVIARARRTGKIANVFADRGQAGHDLIAFGDLVVNAVVARSRPPEDLERLLQSFPPVL